jgi:serine/arginine repetitive matrix protein 2
VGVDLIRQKFAAKRASGSPNVISEEEEELVVSFLQSEQHKRQVRQSFTLVDDRTEDQLSPVSPDGPYDMSDPVPHSAFGSTFANNIQTSHLPPSTLGSSTLATPASPAKSTNSLTPSYHSKRYSNNIFGSGRLRDEEYTIRQAKKSASNRQAAAAANAQIKQQQEQSHQQPLQPAPQPIQASGDTEDFDPQDYIVDTYYSDHISSEGDHDEDQPSMPQQYQPLDFPSTPNDTTPPSTPSRQPPQTSSSPSISPFNSAYAASRPNLGFGRAYSAAQIHRASLALEEVIRDFELDANAEERILTPRSPSIGTTSSNGSHSGSARKPNNQSVSSNYEFLSFPGFVVPCLLPFLLPSLVWNWSVANFSCFPFG